MFRTYSAFCRRCRRRNARPTKAEANNLQVRVELQADCLAALGCQADRQRVEVGLIRGASVKTRMRSSAVEKFEIPADRISRLSNAFMGPQIHLLVLDAAPQPLDEDVIPPGALAVHADGDGVAGENAGECRASELRALVGVEDFRPAVTSQSILQGLDAESRFHRDRQQP
jgi:hypothetical protein